MCLVGSLWLEWLGGPVANYWEQVKTCFLCFLIRREYLVELCGYLLQLKELVFGLRLFMSVGYWVGGRLPVGGLF